MVTTIPLAPRAVVVGSGPAGCAAALTLAASGIPVLILEKGASGKDKACGDAWMPAAVGELRRLGVFAEDLGKDCAPFAEICGFAGSRKVWSGWLEGGRGFVARRAVVDQRLRDRVAAHGGLILHRVEATGFDSSASGLRLTVRVGGKTIVLAPSVVVLATGSGCRLSRMAGLDGDAILAASISAYVPRLDPFSMPSFLFGAPSPGYAWAFPAARGLSNVGVCALGKSSASGLSRHMDAFLARLGQPRDVAVRGGCGAMWGGGSVRWHDESGVLACGDAAGLVDPNSGEGLTAALVSGRKAGEAAAAFLSGRSEALVDYSGWLTAWAGARYARTIESRVFAAWVGLAPTEQRLLALLAAPRRTSGDC